MLDMNGTAVGAHFDQAPDGYNTQQVDEHLAALGGSTSAAPVAAALLERALRIAEETTGAAQTAADELCVSARDQADLMVREAQDRAAAFLEQATESAAQRVAEADAKVVVLQEQIRDLVARRDAEADTVSALAHELLAAASKVKVSSVVNVTLTDTVSPAGSW